MQSSLDRQPGRAPLTEHQREILRRRAALAGSSESAADITFGSSLSLYFFPARTAEGYYRFLFEACMYADAAAFESVWLPERHFVDFGHNHPNPVVLGAAVAARTTSLQIRAGSVAAPLHHPVRLAEDWALLDQISDGRAGLSLATGWHPQDFVLAATSYEDRRETTWRTVNMLRSLWKGTKLSQWSEWEGVDVELAIRPYQTSIPIWLTTGGSRESFVRAAELGCGVMTALLGQSLPELRENVAAYREAWKQGDGIGKGHVALMVHTHVSDEPATKEMVRRPMMDYLSSHKSQSNAPSGQDDTQFDIAFESYWAGPSLLGSSQKCAAVLRELSACGVDEVGALVDFGMPYESVLSALPALKRVFDAVRSKDAAS